MSQAEFASSWGAAGDCLQAINDARWAALRRGWERANRSGTESEAQGDDDDGEDNEEALQMMREMEEEEERRQEEERLAWLAEREKSKVGGGGGGAVPPTPVTSTPGSLMPPSPLPTAEDVEQVRNAAGMLCPGAFFTVQLFNYAGGSGCRGRVHTFHGRKHGIRTAYSNDHRSGWPTSLIGSVGCSLLASQDPYSEDEDDWMAEMQAQEEAEAKRQEEERLQWLAEKEAKKTAGDGLAVGASPSA